MQVCALQVLKLVFGLKLNRAEPSLTILFVISSIAVTSCKNAIQI